MRLRLVAIFITAASVAACRSGAGVGGPPILQPGAPGQPSQAIEADRAADLSRVSFTEADVQFMQGMIGHHAQAVEMVALVPGRSASEGVPLLAKRIEISQADEIGMMERWLTDRGQPLPDPHAHHGSGILMPGMLSEEEMDRLKAAKGLEFDRLFLEGMIKHHLGALTMVRDLFAVGGAGQESEIFTFSADVDADQRMEIERMGAMLQELEP